MSRKIFFDTEHLYYLPQYLPVITALSAKGNQATVVFHDTPSAAIQNDVTDAGGLVEVRKAAVLVEFYRQSVPDWIVFGNSAADLMAQLDKRIKTALMMHGTDVSFKNACDTQGLAGFGVRFVGSPCRMQPLATAFPATKMVDVGYAKLAPLFPHALEPKNDSESKTILYAPTFYPSSIERMAKDWPSQFPECKIVIKPHHFSLEKKSYKAQRKRLDYWEGRYSNVEVVREKGANLLPYMQAADLMISDASSATFEFAALEKPVVVCEFWSLRWNYRGPFKYRLKKRMAQDRPAQLDLFAFASNPKELRNKVLNGLSGKGVSPPNRDELIYGAVGERDGQAGERVANYLLAS